MTKKELDNFIINALIEDVGEGDHSSLGSIRKHTRKGKYELDGRWKWKMERPPYEKNVRGV